MLKSLSALVLASASVFTAFAPPTYAAGAIDPALKDRAKQAVDEGLSYLRAHQEKDGSWSGSVGVTALALRAYLESYRKYREDDGPFITKPVKYLLAHQNSDGSLSESNQNRNYNTAVAINALVATENPAHADAIKAGQKYIKDLQLDESDEYTRDHKYYGGIGYGGDERPDLSNAHMAIEALRNTSFDPKDPVWEKALVFVNRSQNRSESNDQPWAANDGGFTYMPGYSPHGGTGSYGSMTHAGLIALLFAGVDKKDPRVQAAYNWIRANYTLESNPGAKNNQGLFYYYQAFAKSMAAYGEDEIIDDKGAKHNWREDLMRQLLKLRDKDGSWVNNDSPRWWEGDRNLVTAWSIIALNLALR
jgi:squalene-hopene/tetraprenyl-beta-curcumene cyclase